MLGLAKKKRIVIVTRIRRAIEKEEVQ